MIVLLCALCTAFAGHIYSGPSRVTYSTPQLATEFQFMFLLENDLAAHEYFKINFPFALHQQNSPQDVVALLYTTGHRVTMDSP